MHDLHRVSPSWGLLGFSSGNVNVRRSVHIPGYHFIITQSLSDRRDIWGTWPLIRNPDRRWWHGRTSWKANLAVVHGSMKNRSSLVERIFKNTCLYIYYTRKYIVTTAEEKTGEIQQGDRQWKLSDESSPQMGSHTSEWGRLDRTARQDGRNEQMTG